MGEEHKYDKCFLLLLTNSLFDTVCCRPPLSFSHLKIIYDKNREVLENAIATEAEWYHAGTRAESPEASKEEVCICMKNCIS